VARSNDPWQQVAMVTGLAALVGAGAGASSALVFAERRAAAQDREIASLERRLTTLERLNDRVTRLEAGPSSPARRSQAG
jgi:Tfp pilus assembly protein PilN